MSLAQTQQTITRYFDLMGAAVILPSATPPMSPGPRLTLGMKSVARPRFVTTLLPCTTTCSMPRREGSLFPMGMHILRATAFRRQRTAVPDLLLRRYDIVDGRITAMRCYGPIARMAP